MAGTEAYQLRGDFDPRTMTLREYATMYETKAREEGGRQIKNWTNKIFNNPVYKDFLDQPVINIFDAKLKINGKNIQQAAEEAEAKLPKGGSPSSLQSKIRTLEEGIFVKLSDIDASEGTNLSAQYRPVSSQVQKLQTRGEAKTARIQYTTSKIGDLVRNLEAHVEKNPKDKPVANAILYLLETGSRPSLPSELTSEHYVKDMSTPETRLLGASGADGVLIPAGTRGTKRQAKGQTANVQPYNAPLSQRAVTILQDQSDYNATKFGDNRRLNNFFQIENADGSLRPIKLDDINRVLEETSPDGIIQKIGEKGGITPTNKKLKSSDMRKLFINAAEAAGIPKSNVAALISRDVEQNTGSHGVYIGNAGEYSPNAVNDLNQISRQMWGQYSLGTEEGKVEFTKNNLLSTNTLLFGDNTESRTKTRSFETFGEGRPLSIPIQVGGFSAPTVDDPSKAPSGPAPSAATTEADRNRFTSVLNSIDWNNIGRNLKSYLPGPVEAGLAAATAYTVMSADNRAEAMTDVAADVAIETAGTAARIANLPLATVQMALQSSEAGPAGVADVVPEEEAQRMEKMVGQEKKRIDWIPALEVEEEKGMSFFDMERIVTEDTAMDEQNRVAEIMMEDTAYMNRDEAPANESFMSQ